MRSGVAPPKSEGASQPGACRTIRGVAAVELIGCVGMSADPEPTTKSPPQRLTPVAAAERIDSLDVLRGFAVLGILVMNIQSFSMPGAAYMNPTAYGDLTGANLWVWILSHLFADQKFMTIFSALFGAGIVLMWQRAEARGRNIGTVAAGRIGLSALRKMKPFDVHLHYFDKHRLPKSTEKELNLTYHESVESMIAVCDVVTINCPLHPETENLFDEAMISKMKKGAYLVNTARGKICNKDAIAKALKSGQLSGYAGDVWFPQPPPNDHVWRTMPNHGMTPHTSGTSLSAQARYAAGTREILECFFDGKPIRNQYLIVKDGELAGMGAHSYSKGSATGGSEEAAKYKK